MNRTYITCPEFRTYQKSLRRALKLQAREYERRLEKLNGEHETNIQNWLQSVRKDTFEEYKKVTDQKIDTLERKEDERSGRVALFRMLSGAGALGLVLQLLQLLGWVPR